MKITSVNFNIWINPDENGKQFNNCDEVEFLLKEITDLIKSKGYYMKPKMYCPNPSLHIVKG